MSSKDSHLYNPRPHNLSNGKEISSSTTLVFTSTLSSLINTSKTTTSNTPTSKTSTRLKPKKDDLFHRRPKGSTAKRAKRDDESSPTFEQKHTTDGERLDPRMWERSKRRMEEKARLYAAMKRGDVEDAEEKYAVDFDRKWAETHKADEVDSDEDAASSSEEEGAKEMVDYVDEFGRTRTGTRAEVARAQRIAAAQSSLQSDRFTARPAAPSNVIYGDTIQSAAFNPDTIVSTQMEELAKKRDKSLTPPPDSHFDATKEVRGMGTGFFRFSGDEAERARQMAGLEAERVETERRRGERQSMLEERKRVVEERRREVQMKKGKRKAEVILEELGVELGEKIDTAVGKRDDERQEGEAG